jgi:hypothetical protein
MARSADSDKIKRFARLLSEKLPQDTQQTVAIAVR